MLDLLGSNWWVLLIRGIAAVIFGVLALAWPELTVGALVIIFGIFALLDGIVEIAGIFERRNTSDLVRWVRAIRGIISIVIGLVAIIWPAITAVALLYLIAIWALVIGAIELYIAFRLREEITGRWLLGIAGLLSIAFGIIAIIFPGAGILSLIWLLGIYAILFGLALIALAFRIRSWYSEWSERA